MFQINCEYIPITKGFLFLKSTISIFIRESISDFHSLNANSVGFKTGICQSLLEVSKCSSVKFQGLSRTKMNEGEFQELSRS